MKYLIVVMVILYAVVLGLANATAAPVGVEADPQTCRPPATALVEVHTDLLANNSFVSWLDLAGEQKDAFLARYNAHPPATDVTADMVRIYSKVGSTVDLVMFLTNDCVTLAEEVPHWAVLELTAGLVEGQ